MMLRVVGLATSRAAALLVPASEKRASLLLAPVMAAGSLGPPYGQHPRPFSAAARQEKLMEAFEKMDVGSRGFMDRSALRDGWKRWGITDHTTSKKVEELHAKKKAARKEDKLQRKLASEAGDNHKLGTIYKNALKKYNETEGEIRSLEPVVSSLVQASADRTFQQLTGGADGGGEGKVTLEDWMSKLPESLQASIEMQFTEKPYDPNDPEQQFGDPYGMLTKER